MKPSKDMSKAKQIDDLTSEEVKDIEEFYADDEGKKRLSGEDFLKELKDQT